MQTINSANGMRTVLQEKKLWVQQKYKDAGEMVVLIKPTKQAFYSNVINTLDEMQMNYQTLCPHGCYYRRVCNDAIKIFS